MPPAAETVRAEAMINRNTESSPGRSWRRSCSGGTEAPSRSQSDKLWVDVVTTPWELARARKVFPCSTHPDRRGRAALWRRAMARSGTSWTGPDPHAGDRPSIVLRHELWRLFQTTPLTFNFLCEYARISRPSGTATRSGDGRSSRSWPSASGRCGTKGTCPRRSPSSSRRNPGSTTHDPYHANHAFRYVRSSGQALLPLGDLEPLGVQPLPSRTGRSDSRLLYSVGPDLRDDGAARERLEPSRPGRHHLPAAGAEPGETIKLILFM